MCRWFHGNVSQSTSLLCSIYDLQPGFDTTLLTISDITCQEKNLIALALGGFKCWQIFGTLGSKCKKYLERTRRINVRLTLTPAEKNLVGQCCIMQGRLCPGFKFSFAPPKLIETK